MSSSHPLDLVSVAPSISARPGLESEFSLSADVKRLTFRPRRIIRDAAPARNIDPAKIWMLFGEISELSCKLTAIGSATETLRISRSKTLRRSQVHLQRHGTTTDVQMIERPEGSSFIPTALAARGGIVAQNVPQTLPPKMAARIRTP